MDDNEETTSEQLAVSIKRLAGKSSLPIQAAMAKHGF